MKLPSFTCDMSRKMMRSVNRILWDSDLIATRVTLAGSEALWALLLWLPGVTFGRPTYHYMSMVMDEHWWGLVFAITSAIQTYIVLSGDFHTVFARWFAFWNMLLWGGVVISMLASVSPPPAAISAEIMVAITSVWVWARPLLLTEIHQRVRAN